MLVKHDRVAIGICENHVSRAGAVRIRFCHEGKAGFLELALQVSHISKTVQSFLLVVPTGIESQDVGGEHALE